MWEVTEGQKPAVLVLTHWFDPTADWVVCELNRRRVPVFRFDAADFPTRLVMSAELSSGQIAGTLRLNDRAVRLQDVTGIYYRRPTIFEFPDGMSEPERRWATLEARLGFGGVLASIPGWLNHPHDIARAEYKPFQLRLAAHSGLITPRTLISNDPSAVDEFAKQAGDVAYKPFSAAGIQEDGRHKALFANKLTPKECSDPSIALTAHAFQEWIDSQYAVRLTYVDGRMFAVAIRADSDSAQIDWRSDYSSLSYEQITAPLMVQRGIEALMSKLHLRFGAFDFLVRPSGDWVFLEVNPNGQWAWISETVESVASAIADALTRKAPTS